MATYKLRPQAASDLRTVRRWIARDDPHRARTFIVELTEHFRRLAGHRGRHRVLHDIGADIRRAVHSNYNIYYRRVGENGTDVVVVRVLHAAQDLSKIEFE